MSLHIQNVTASNQKKKKKKKKKDFRVLPVVMMADLIAAELQSGYSVFRRPTTPETWGQDIDVPELMLNGNLRVSNSVPVGLCASLYEAMIFTPGAVMSG